ncbi:MAG TPA: hypothetical protein VM686_16025 [Polyangiaceae bacterium]|nr:hypothetical protein [Polyangiaceae bacterium]
MTSPPPSYRPGPLGRVDDYASGQMHDAQAAAFEEQLFDAAATGTETDAAFLHELARLSTWLTRRGLFNVGSTRAQVDAILRSGHRTHMLELSAKDSMNELPRWSDDIEIVITRVDVDLRGYEDVDIVLESPSGEAIKTFRDVTYDPAEGAIYGVCEEPLARIAFSRGHVVSRVTAVRRDGASKRETIAVFHSRPAP